MTTRHGLYRANVTLVIEGTSQADANDRARDIANLLYRIQHIANTRTPGARLMDLYADLEDRLTSTENPHA